MPVRRGLLVPRLWVLVRVLCGVRDVPAPSS